MTFWILRKQIFCTSRLDSIYTFPCECLCFYFCFNSNFSFTTPYLFPTFSHDTSLWPLISARHMPYPNNIDHDRLVSITLTAFEPKLISACDTIIRACLSIQKWSLCFSEHCFYTLHWNFYPYSKLFQRSCGSMRLILAFCSGLFPNGI